MPEKPVMHGRDHRPGGMDPIPFTSLATIWLAVDEFFTGTLASHTDRTVDFSSSTVHTNDDGTNFSWNFASHPWINILTSGIWIVHYYWEIITFSSGGVGATPTADYVMALTDACPSIPGAANDPANHDTAILGDSHIGQFPAVNHTRFSSGSGQVDMGINFRTSSVDDSINVSEYHAGITIVGLPQSYLEGSS